MGFVIQWVKKLRCKVNGGYDLVNYGECVSIWIARNRRLTPLSCTNSVHCVAGMDDVLKVELVLAPEFGVSAPLDLNGCRVGAQYVIKD